METVLDAGTDTSTRIAGPGGPTLDVIDAGSRVDDFDLLTGLGRGAFARVYLARQRSMQRLVAVKISHNHGSEPQTLAHLDHDHIVRVFDQRLIADDQLKLMYMQYVPGGTLLGVLRRVRETPPALRSGRLLLDAVDEELLNRGGIRPSESRVRAEIARSSWPETVAWLGRRLADALDYANRRGVLHRDIKPANVLLTAEGSPKLADFNISFSHHLRGSSPLSYFGGSLSYMSPEQLEAAHPGMPRTAAELDTRSDIYALGVMLWELLTGRRPFDDEPEAGQSDTSVERMLALRRHPVSRRFVAELPPDCPAALRRVLLSALQPDRERRPSSGRELAAMFDLCLDPRARELIDPPDRSWQARLTPWTLLVTTLAGVIGNIAAVTYNRLHNGQLMGMALSAAEHAKLDSIGVFVDWPFYPILFLLLLYLCRRPLLVPRGLRRGRRYDSATLAKTRAEVLTVGDRAALVGVIGWLVAGSLFVTGLRIAGDVPLGLTVHLLVSLLVCGAISVSYPFFLVTFWYVHCVYPPLLRHGGGDPAGLDAQRLAALGRRAAVYLAIAASVPLIGVLTGVSFLSPGQLLVIIGPMRWLCVGGVLAFVGAYWLFRVLEADLRALQRVVATGV